MTLSNTINEALRLRSEIEARDAQLKECEAALMVYALAAEAVPLVDEDREGTRVLLRGEAATLPVIFTADSLSASLPPEGDTVKELLRLCGAEENRAQALRLLAQFYATKPELMRMISDGKKFRAKVRELLPEEAAERFIDACIARDKHGMKKSRAFIDYDGATEVGTSHE